MKRRTGKRGCRYWWRWWLWTDSFRQLDYQISLTSRLTWAWNGRNCSGITNSFFRFSSCNRRILSFSIFLNHASSWARFIHNSVLATFCVLNFLFPTFLTTTTIGLMTLAWDFLLTILRGKHLFRIYDCVEPAELRVEDIHTWPPAVNLQGRGCVVLTPAVNLQDKGY